MQKKNIRRLTIGRPIGSNEKRKSRRRTWGNFSLVNPLARSFVRLVCLRSVALVFVVACCYLFDVQQRKKERRRNFNGRDLKMSSKTRPINPMVKRILSSQLTKRKCDETFSQAARWRKRKKCESIKVERKKKKSSLCWSTSNEKRNIFIFSRQSTNIWNLNSKKRFLTKTRKEYRRSDKQNDFCREKR